MTEEQQVALDEQLGHDAQKTLELLGDFDEQYTKAIVANILSCDPKDFESWRSLLKAKDAFVAYLTDKVRDGELATYKMSEINTDDIYDGTLND